MDLKKSGHIFIPIFVGGLRSIAYVEFSKIELLVRNKRLKCAFFSRRLENTGFSPTTIVVIIFLAGSFLKMAKRTNLTVNDRQLLKDFRLERVEKGQLRRGYL